MEYIFKKIPWDIFFKLADYASDKDQIGVEMLYNM